VFARVGSRWFLADRGSANGTFIRRSGQLVRVASETELDHGDVVCIVGRWERKRPRYWELAYSDTTRTRAVDITPGQPELAYIEATRRLVLRAGDARYEIALRPQAHRLVLHIARRNAGTQGEPVLCSHDELMEAVWGSEPFHTRNDLARLFWELRRKLEPHGADELVEAARGLGYRVAITLA
ncbi:MAG TPA: winged helix-turn-helix domain-containing protein, partial [Gaiellaceae bacterium]|nr:winged helix-turn-helix domain-containing protein [Gaiellaceae bacterium]